MRSTAIFFGLLTVAAASASQMASAMPGASVSTTVQIRDLDLSSAHGRKQLQKRLSNAAAEVCGQPSAADLVANRAITDCRVSVIESATSDLAQRQTAGRLAAR